MMRADLWCSASGFKTLGCVRGVEQIQYTRPPTKKQKKEINKMTTIPNIEVIKTKMKEAWNAGHYGTFATYMEPGAVNILESWNIPYFLDLISFDSRITWIRNSFRFIRELISYNYLRRLS